MIEVKNDSELQKMREAGKVTAAVLKLMTELVHAGIGRRGRKDDPLLRGDAALSRLLWLSGHHLRFRK